MASRFAHLSREELERRLAKHEPAPLASSSQAGPSRPARPSVPRGQRNVREFNFASYPTRHVALLLSYEGWPYSGLALQPRQEDWSPTIEGELLRALEKARLIEGGKGWEGCEFARCGRTDKGVSGAGQVVNLWIRSTRHKEDVNGPEDSWREATEPLPPRISRRNGTTSESTETLASEQDHAQPLEDAKPVQMVRSTQEVPYVKVLNSHLPPSIRVLAWSPVSPGFNARFSCQYRHYKYAFHRVPSPGLPSLDLDAMRQGADRLLGEHDFRNFCKVDGSKQIENHNRRVLRAWFDKGASGATDGHKAEPKRSGAAYVNGSTGLSGAQDSSSTNGGPSGTALEHLDNLPGASHVPDNMIVFNLIGTAFLWHQVRHILAILFLIGSRLEDPSIIADLLDVQKAPRRPLYMMASGLPLRLHQCGYPDDELDWRVSSHDGPMSVMAAVSDDSGASEVGKAASQEDQEMERAGRLSILRGLEVRRQEAEIRLWQTRGALDRFKEVFGEDDECPRDGGGEGDAVYSGYPSGGGEMVTGTKYVPISDLKVGETVEDINRNYREGRGKIKMTRREAEGKGEAGGDE